MITGMKGTDGKYFHPCKRQGWAAWHVGQERGNDEKKDGVLLLFLYVLLKHQLLEG